MSMWKLKGKVEVVEKSGSEYSELEEDEENDTEVMEEDEEEVEEVEQETRPKRNGRQKTGKSEEEELPTIPVSSRSTKKMMVIHKGVGECGWDKMEQVTLKHPRTGHKGIFLIDASKTTTELETENSKNFFFFEVMTMEQDTRSWFLDEAVVSDGNMYVSTPMDPLFFVLPYLMKSTQAKPLEDHLSEGFASTRIVDILSRRLLTSNQLENIAIKKECDDIVAFKYSEENTLSWLSDKVENTLKFLADREITSTEASISANFTKSSNGTTSDDSQKREEYLRYACEIVGEYLEDELKKKVFVKFGLPTVQEKSVGAKRKSENDCLSPEETQNKKVKVADGENIVEPLEDYGSSKNSSSNSPATHPKGKAKEKEFLKAAKGTHSLLKFFTPKAK